MVQEKLRAVFYARVSTEEERQLNALEKQVAECKDAVLQKGWKLVDQYVDEGKSGTQIKRRDEYKRLFEDLENDKFDIVVIKSQDRLQRNTLDWYIWIDRLTTHGKRLYMYLEDTFYSPDNALISGIKAILAEEYSRELSKKINNSYKRRIEAAKNGEKISIVNNSRSLGYDKVNGELVINEKEAEVVRMIFNMYASGEGLRAISNTLYDMGYRNRSGNEIDPTTISRMLSSEKYKGVYVINQRHYDFDTKKTVLNPKSEWVHIPGAVPAIVEPELWDRVQEIKGSKVQSIKNEKRGRNCGKSIFSGKIYCAKCGAKYWRSLENGYVKFKCSSYSKYGKIPGKGCDNKSFSEDALYSILQSLSEQIVEINTAEVRKSLLNWLKSLRERLRASQGDDTIKEEIRKQTARKEKLTDAYMDGIISKEDYSKRYKELEKTLEDLKDKLLTLEVNEDLQSIEEVIQNIDKEMEEYLQTQSFNENRVEFLNQHLTKVTVNKDSFLLEFDLIGGAILTGKDFYLFVDNPRAGSEGVQCCWQDRFQEFQRTLFADQLYRETVHYNSEAKECHIQNDKLCCKGNDRFSSVGFHNRYDGTENTDGCKVHDGCDDLQAYFIDGINQIQEWSSFFTDCDQCETDDQGKHQNLEHVSVSKCGDWVGRDQVFQGVKDTAHFCSLDICCCHLKFDSLSEMDQSRDDQSAQAGKCRCAEKIDHGCCSDLAGSTRVSDGTDSNDNGTEDHRKDHHVQGVHVDTSDQTGHSEDRFKPSGQEKSCEDTQDQSCKDRTGNMLPVPGIKRFHLCVPS